MKFAILVALILGSAARLAATGADDPELRYNPATVIDFTGRIEDIREVAAPQAIRGTHLIILSERHGRVDTYLGPTSFVRDFLPYFGKGSEVQVIGSRVRSEPMALVLARQVRKGETTLYLRDERGNPFWIGGI